MAVWTMRQQRFDAIDRMCTVHDSHIKWDEEHKIKEEKQDIQCNCKMDYTYSLYYYYDYYYVVIVIMTVIIISFIIIIIIYYCTFSRILIFLHLLKMHKYSFSMHSAPLQTKCVWASVCVCMFASFSCIIFVSALCFGMNAYCIYQGLFWSRAPYIDVSSDPIWCSFFRIFVVQNWNLYLYYIIPPS